MKIIEFEEFKVYKDDDKYSFIYMYFDNEKKFYEGLISYIFDEKNLLLYSELSTGLKFNPGRKEYTKLYKNISYFLNDNLMSLPVVNLDVELERILNEEFECIKDSNGKLLIKQDKVGKIGEYIFHLILTKYFDYTCVIPKFRTITDRNMSAFGIDTLFYDSKNGDILFGEAKFSKHLNNGITLVNRSLEEYEQNINEEYLLILSNDCFKLNCIFLDKYKDTIEVCRTFEEFIKEANINSIVIPIFIAHGNKKTDNVAEIMNKLGSIKKQKMLGLNTKYLIISLPVIDKDRFAEYAIRMAVNKVNEYASK